MNNQEKTYTKYLPEAFLSLKSEEEVASFIRDLMTPQEIETLEARLYAAALLQESYQSYRDIAKKTGLSTTTITRVALWLNKGMNGYKKVIDRVFVAKQLITPYKGYHHENGSADL